MNALLLRSVIYLLFICKKLFWKSFSFGHAFCLAKVPLTMCLQNRKTVVQIVCYKTQERRRDDRFRRIDVPRQISQVVDHLGLMFGKTLDYRAVDLARGRLSLCSCLHFFRIIRPHGFDQKSSKKAAQWRRLFPEGSAQIARRHSLKQRKILTVYGYQMIEALRDAPAFFGGLPVELRCACWLLRRSHLYHAYFASSTSRRVPARQT